MSKLEIYFTLRVKNPILFRNIQTLIDYWYRSDYQMILRKLGMMKPHHIPQNPECMHHSQLNAQHRYPQTPICHRKMSHNPYGSESTAEFRNNTSIKVQSIDYKIKIPESEKVLTP